MKSSLFRKFILLIQEKKVLLLGIIALTLFSFGVFHLNAASVPRTFNMGDAANWNLRFDGPTDTAGLSGAMPYAALAFEDFDNDGEDDLITGARRFDANNRVDSGSTFLISHKLFKNFSGTGNTIDLNNPQNYTLRIDGAAPDDQGQRTFQFADLDQDGKNDLIFADYRSDFPIGRINSGGVYVVSGKILEKYAGTGNTLDLADPSKYTLRIDGFNGSFTSSVKLDDFNSDGDLDFFIASPYADYRPAGLPSGSVYIVLHDIFRDALNGTGNLFDLENPAHFTTRIDGSLTESDQFPGLLIGGILTVFDSFTVGDFDDDEKPDLVLAEAAASHNNRFAASSLYLISNDLLSLSGTGNIRTLDDPETYTVRYDGASTTAMGRECPLFLCGGALGYFGALAIGDVDGDERNDLVFAENASNNSRPFSGSTYVLNADLLEHYSGSGEQVVLTDPNTYSLRFDGAVPRDRHTHGGHIRIADLNNDGGNDLILGATGNEISSTELHPGKIYVIFQELYSDYDPESTGNVIDLVDENNWSFRYDGETPGDWLGGSSLEFSDVNQDETLDLIAGAWGTSYNSNGSGSVYIVYYFPHEIEFDTIFSKTSGRPFNVTGTVKAPDNSTFISAVQWGHDRSFGDDSGEFHATWKDCTPIDGAFDSNEERFSCAHRALNDGSGDPHFASPHQVFFRARDSKGIYTPISKYPTRTYLVDSAISNFNIIFPSKTNATLNWTTSEPGSTRVEYGLTEKYGMSTPETDTNPRSTAHTTIISNLNTKCTTYHYRVVSRDVGGNEAFTPDKTFQVNCNSLSPKQK